MTLFLNALLTQGFLQNALLGGMLASIVCGVVGPFVVIRRIGYVAGAIAHTALGGMGVATFFGWDPYYGALIAALFSAVLVSAFTKYSPKNEDSLINAMWSFGMGIGIIFIAKTPGYSIDLVSYLFGNILMISNTDLIWMVVLAILIIAFVFLYFKQLVAISFDEEFSRVLGLRVDLLTLALHCLIALSVVVLIRVVGLVLVIALLTIPVVTVEFFCQSVGKMMLSSIALGAFNVFTALAFSYYFNLPAGATAVATLAVGFVVGFALKVLTKQKPVMIGSSNGE